MGRTAGGVRRKAEGGNKTCNAGQAGYPDLLQVVQVAGCDLRLRTECTDSQRGGNLAVFSATSGVDPFVGLTRELLFCINYWVLPKQYVYALEQLA